MIPWIEILFYIGIVFAPEDTYQISFEIENRTHTFNRQESGDIWYPIADKSQEWTVEKDTLFANIQGRKTPFYFPIDLEMAQKAFNEGRIYQIDRGFTLTREVSGILVIFDPGLSLEKHQIKWKIKD